MTYDPSKSWEDNQQAAEAIAFLPPVPYVRGDLPSYISPITGKPVDGRSARREDLKRSGCIEMDPPARKRGFINERFAKKHGATVDPESVEKIKKPQRIDPLSTL